MKTLELLSKIAETRTISENEILLLKRRKNNGEKFDESIYWNEEIKCTDEQNTKGIEFLRNLHLTPKGKERLNSPFGYREIDALNSFTHLEFRGFYDNGDRNHSYFLPIYICVGSECSFEYYYDGKVEIIG